MERILLITHYTPTKDNYNGPSALMYHLMKNRAHNIELRILSFNRNQVPDKLIRDSSKALNATITIITKSVHNLIFTSNKLDFFFKILGLRRLSADSYYSLSSSIIKYVDSYKPQLIFLYPHISLTIAKQLFKYKIIVCGPDCVSLHYSRLLRDQYSFLNDKAKIKSIIHTYYCRLLMEKEWSKIDNASLYLVGYVDCCYFNIINNIKKAYFFPHPHYELINKNISLQHERLSIIISGKYDLYTYTDITNMVISLEKTNLKIKERYSFTFLGKGWTNLVKRLKQANYTVDYINWVDNYTSFISKFDIQIFPISVGSGTKGKALDALSTGLLCIGSKYSFENIAINNFDSCIIYDNVDEIPFILNDILNNKSKYENIATNGREKIRVKHSPSYIMNSIIRFSITGKYEFNINDYFKLELK